MFHRTFQRPLTSNNINTSNVKRNSNPFNLYKYLYLWGVIVKIIFQIFFRYTQIRGEAMSRPISIELRVHHWVWNCLPHSSNKHQNQHHHIIITLVLIHLKRIVMIIKLINRIIIMIVNIIYFSTFKIIYIILIF